jgi:hypothetical protein
MQRIFCVLLILSATLVLAARPARADPLETGFQHPPAFARPHTWWHWMNGNVTREGITADLEAMKRVGIGGAQIFNVDCGIPAGPAKFMSPEWRELVKHAAQEAQRLGLELCLHNCAGWSSSGGPWNTPEHAMQSVTTSERRVTGPAHFSGALPAPPAKLDFYRDIAVLAFPAPGGKNAASGRVVPRAAIADLSSRLQPGGRIEWDVPPGEWIILRVGYTPTGQENHPAPAEGTGLECDKFSQEALDAHWAGFVQKVLDDLGPLAGQGKTFNNVLIDSYEVGEQNWTPRGRAEFQKRRGYDPLLYLPTVAGWMVENPAVTERFRWDVLRTIADLFAENYYGHFQELCHQHGLMASFEPYTGPFESLQCGQSADIPMGEFWVGSSPDPSVKLASSVGHIYGRQIIGAESFTGAPSPKHGRWLDDGYSLKALGDQVFCQGVNRFIFHRYAMQPWTNRWPGMTMGQWGTHFDRTSTWWEQGRAWLQYVTRCQYLLQQGHFVADAAYFDGESAPVELPAADPPLPPGYDYDGINAGVLLRATVSNGRLVLPSGMSYRVLILPPSQRTMTPVLLRKLAQLVDDGLTLIGPPPQASPSLEDYPQCDDEVKQLAARMWGKSNGRRMTEHQYGLGKVVWNRPLARVFTELDLKPDFEYPAGSDAQLAFIHRRDGETDIYFVSNQRSRFDTADCTFRVSGKLPELWNPGTGRIEPAPVWREHGGRTVVPLSLDPVGSVFVVFRSQRPGDHLVALERKEPARAEPKPKPAKLRILKAIYGPSENAADVTTKVKSLVTGGASEVRAGNELAEDDPAPGVVKRLRVQFLLNGRQQTATATEGETLKLPEGAQVLNALYGHLPNPGDPKQNRRDVTAKVRQLLAHGTLQIPAGNDIAGGDPAPNTPKQLRIEFRANGRTQTAEAKEGQTLDLPADAEVTKALYGDLHPGSAPRSRSVDLTRKLAALVKHGELSVPVDNQLAGGDPAYLAPKELRVEYSLAGVRKRTTIQENDTLTLPESAQSLGASPFFSFIPCPDGQMQLLAWAPGKFSFRWASGGKNRAACRSLPAPLPIPGPWAVNFPPGWAAPASVTFDCLQSWTDHTNPGVKYFSGTATYEKEFEVPPDWLTPTRVICLDLGAVKNFAEVSLNGESLGILWKPPFRVDVTAAARPGKNTLTVKVTNLWPNRLIGDEQLPPDCEWNGKELKAWPPWLLEGKSSPTGRSTFTTWRHWTKGDPLLASGLLGPVTLRLAETVMPR